MKKDKEFYEALFENSSYKVLFQTNTVIDYKKPDGGYCFEVLHEDGESEIIEGLEIVKYLEKKETKQLVENIKKAAVKKKLQRLTED